MNYTAEILAVLMFLWFISVMYIAFLFGKLTFSYLSYELIIYKFHRHIITYIFAFPIFIIALALLKVIGE